MTICLNCGKSSADLLCEDCRNTVDTEELCEKILQYDSESNSEQVLDKITAELINAGNLRFAVFGLSESFIPEKKLYYRMLAIKGKSHFFPKSSRKWLKDNSAEMLESNELTAEQKQTAEYILLNCYLNDYDYQKAEETVNRLCKYNDLSVDAKLQIADHYIKTRRYSKADAILNELMQESLNDTYIEAVQKSLEESRCRQLGKGNGGYAEYLPASDENRIKYRDFLADLGIEVKLPEVKEKKSIPKPLEESAYPEFADERNAGFSDFVAYDVETTGLSPKLDSIIEIGAVKVRSGEIIERFQKLVKPFKKSISPKITEITGITMDMVRNADEMWDAFKQFADFAGDDILIGYNNRTFDNKFLVRAGRYANVVLKNRSFDVMYFASELKGELGFDKQRVSLSDLSEMLKIENPQAHRALADAETTAKIYLRLLEIGGYEKTNSLDDILNEEWE